MREEKKSLIDFSTKVRGTIIHMSIGLEKSIDRLLTSYFIVKNHKKEWQFLELILDRTSFDSKIAVLEQILKHRFDTEYTKNAGKFMSSLRYLKDERNRFAHQAVYTNYQENEEIPKLEFVLVDFRNKVKGKAFTKADSIIFSTKINKCGELLAQWIKEIDESGWVS